MKNILIDYRKELFIIFTILLFFIVRFLIIGRLQLAPDEAYYWYWSKHLDFSYADHPPLVAYIMAAFTAIGGNTEFFVRLGGMILCILSLCFLYKSCVILFPKDKSIAWEILFLINITLLFSAGCIVQTPDTPLFFFWMAAFYCASKVISDGQAKYWYWGGVALGFGLLSKYTMILIIPCLFLFFLVSPRDRHWLKRKEPYLAILIALIIFSPVIYWNWQHNWVSFLYQLQHGLAPKKIQIFQILSKLLEYLGGQAGIVTPLLFISFVIYSIKGVFQSTINNNRIYLFLVCLSWPIFIFFWFSSALGKVAEANWPAPAYIAGGILSLDVFNRFYKNNVLHKYFVSAGIVLVVIINILIHIHLIFPFLPIPAKIDPTNQFHGWRELGTVINDYVKNTANSENIRFIAGDRGTIVAEAVFYTNNNFIGIDFKQPQRYIFLKDIGYLKEKDAIIITRDSGISSLKKYEDYFASCEFITAYDLLFRDEKIKSYRFLIARGNTFRGNWSPLP